MTVEERACVLAAKRRAVLERIARTAGVPTPSLIGTARLARMVAEIEYRKGRTVVELTPEMFGLGKNEGKLMRINPDFLTTGDSVPVGEEE